MGKYQLLVNCVVTRCKIHGSDLKILLLMIKNANKKSWGRIFPHNVLVQTEVEREEKWIWLHYTKQQSIGKRIKKHDSYTQYFWLVWFAGGSKTFPFSTPTIFVTAFILRRKILAFTT